MSGWAAWNRPRRGTSHLAANDGATLTVGLAIPASAELRFAAAALFEALAQTAVEGLVEGTCEGRRLDFYPAGVADD